MSTKACRQFTDQQKVEAARIVTQSGKPIAQIAKEMGLTESALRNWVKQASIDQAAAPDGAITTEERQELNRLRWEVKRLQMERDFLKKAAAFFAAESSSPVLSASKQSCAGCRCEPASAELFSPMTRVERENTRLRHYSARLDRKSLYYSKSEEMLRHSIRLLLHYLKWQDVPVPH